LTEISTAFETIEWNAESIKVAVETVGAQHDVKLGKLQGPLRIAITGRTVGPPLFEPIELLGREESQRRIRAALVRAAG
jgi:glutamyl-tRNA synthetase